MKSFKALLHRIKNKESAINNSFEYILKLKNIRNEKYKPEIKIIQNIRQFKNIFNFLFFEFIFLLLPLRILSNEYYIELCVNKKGYNQILSDEYIGQLPSFIYINDKIEILQNKNIYIDSINDKIKLHWNNPISNFSYMFNNLSTITSIYMHYIFANYNNLSYMFYNCTNLKQITYNISYDSSHIMSDLKGMFYNCKSLISFYFNNLYCDSYINMSYMFYNCENLISVSFNNSHTYKANDMISMFYNCISLSSIDLIRISTSYSNFSYMFYNCYFLSSINIGNNFYAKDMSSMFYNCTLLTTMDISTIKRNNNLHINMSRLFSNCINLKTIEGTFINFYISDTREMFSNCSSLEYNGNLYIYNFNDNSLNMSYMFYNCKKIESISFKGYYYYYYNYYSSQTIIHDIKPNDLQKIFFNCISIKTLSFELFSLNNVKDMNYMFYNCKMLVNININKNYFTYDNQLTTNMRGMFQNCESLISLDLSSLSTQNVEIMWDMFKGCSRLQSLLINNFNTRKVTDMESMFEGCSKLISLDLSSFVTPKVQYMNKMFKDCINLQTINFKNIKTDSLATMHQMFYNCKKLTSLNLFSLTEKEQTFAEIFEGTSDNFIFCINDENNIPNIFELLKNKIGTVRDCSGACYSKKRKSIPEKKSCCNGVMYNNTCYKKCPPKTRPSDIDNEICESFNCTYLYNFEQNDCLDYIPDGYYQNDTETVDKCDNNCQTCTGTATNCLSCFNTVPYLYLGICRSSCDSGFYEINNTLKCNCSSIECDECSEDSIKNGQCVRCNENEGYYRKMEDSEQDNNNNSNTNYFKCYKSPSQYYLDKNIPAYKRCYESCETCDKDGTYEIHNCLSCNSNYSFAKKIEKYSRYVNCYKKCEFYRFEENAYSCLTSCSQGGYSLTALDGQCVHDCKDTFEYRYKFRLNCYKNCNQCPEKAILDENDPNKCQAVCPFEKPFEIIKSQMCVSNCTIIQRNNKECAINYKGNLSDSELENMIQNDILADLIKGFNYSNLTENNSVIIEGNNFALFQIIASNNKNKYLNISSIDLLRCEDALKEYYGIDKDEILYIFKMDVMIPEKIGPDVEYQVFYPFNKSGNLEPLDLTTCEGIKVLTSFYHPTDNPCIYDKNNCIYNDICCVYPSDDDVDYILDIRKDYYTNNNLSVCDENCEFEYDYVNQQVNCYCEAKINFPLVSTIKIDKKKLYKFMNIKNIINFNVLKCYKLLFSKYGIEKNIGFYSFLPTFIMYFICLYLFNNNEYKILKKQINDLVWAKLHLKYLQIKKKIKKPNKKNINAYDPIFLQICEKKNMDIMSPKIPIKRRIKTSILDKINIISTNNKKVPNNKNNSKSSLRKINRSKSIKINNLNDFNKSNFSEKNKTNSPPIKKGDNSIYNNKSLDLIGVLSSDEEKKIKLIMKHNDQELNDLEYKEAVRYDRRNYFGFYFSLLKTKHMLFKIFAKLDYNIRSIKIYLCFLNFSLNFTINALFFDDDTMHKIYNDGGNFNIIYQLPQIIYSTIITFIFEKFIEYLALSQDLVLTIKHEKKRRIIRKLANNVLRILHCRFINFFIFSLIFQLIFCYYISCFCAVYRNTQFHLIKDTLISFGTSLLTPLGTSLIPGIFRIPAIKKHKGLLYGFSKLLQLF